MNPLYINLDTSGSIKQSNIISIKSSNQQVLYYRLFEGKYEIDYSTLTELRLIFEDSETTDVYTVSSSTKEIVNNITYIKIIIPLNITSQDKDYTVRPVVNINGKSKGLMKFKFMSRVESSTDIETLIRMTKDINNIFSIYLDSIKRDEIGSANGVVPLDENGKMIENYTPQNILDHIQLQFEGHGLRLDKDYYIEYYDPEDNVYYKLNTLEAGRFGIQRKSSIYDVDYGKF